MKKTGIKKFETITNGIVNLFFFIAVVICCIVMIYALFVFIGNCINTKNQINSLVNNHEKLYDIQTNKCSPDSTEIQNESEDLDNAYYIENLIDYTMKLQELESKSTSTNILTFLYTFLSGTLIGVATFLTKKGADNVKQIKEDKELITNLDGHTLFSNLYMYIQRTYSTMQIFSVSLDAIQNESDIERFVDKYVPKLNDLINAFEKFAGQHDFEVLSAADKKKFVSEINEIGNLIHNLNIPDNNMLITSAYNDITRTEWESQLDTIKKKLK